MTVTRNGEASSADRRITVRRSGPSRPTHALLEVWDRRELLYFFAWREVKVRYKQTVLGISWAILQPLFTMALFSLFFGKLAKIPSDGVPYPIWSYAALLPWQYFSQGVGAAAGSLVGNSNLVRKVYFPRLIIPTSAVLFGLVDLAVASLLLIVMLAYFGIVPDWRVVALPGFLGLAVVTAEAAGLWLSALTARYRDFRFILPFLLQAWLFATPVIYPSRLVPEPWRTLSGINPMASVVEGFRWALLGTETPGFMAALSICSAVALLLSGAAYFRRVERTLADIV